MTEQEFRDIVALTGHEFGLYGISVVVVEKLWEGALADVNVFTYRLRITRYALENYDYTYLLMIIRHELSHLIASRALRVMTLTGHPSKEAHHGPVWRETARNMAVLKEELHPYSKVRNEVARRLHRIPAVSNTTAP